MIEIHRFCFQDFFRCEPGKEEMAKEVAIEGCYKKVTDMWSDARWQAVSNWYRDKEGEAISKDEARKRTLTYAQYMEVSIEHEY